MNAKANRPGGPSTSAEGRELALLLTCHLESYANEERQEALELALAGQTPAESGQENAVEPDASSQITQLGAKAKVRRHAERLLAAVAENATAIDDVIRQHSRKWRLERMDRIDRSIIRLAIAELRQGKTPKRVLVSEAVRIASKYGSDHSASFVNGIVDEIVRSDSTPVDP